MKVGEIRAAVFLGVASLALLSWVDCAVAQQPSNNPPAGNPLIRLLQVKGILTDEEVAQINQGGFPGDSNQRLAKLLLSKGVISQADYDQAFVAAYVTNMDAPAASNASVISAVYRVPVGTAAITTAATNPPSVAP